MHGVDVVVILERVHQAEQRRRVALPDLDRALSWLLGQQTPDGSWQDSSATTIRDTATVLDALASIGRTGAPYQQGVAWLAAHLADQTGSPG